MRLGRLRTYNLPDLADHVIHFTGRDGWKMAVERAIVDMDDQQRLAQILVDGRIRAFQTFRSAAPVVCLTESTKAAVAALIRAGRYTPCGIGFSKQFVFERDGGPSFYVRGDEWRDVAAALPAPARSRAVLFWPGAQPDPGEFLPDPLRTESEWLHEREWRVPSDLTFGWGDVEFVLVPNDEWQPHYAQWVDTISAEHGAAFRAIPTVVMDTDGDVLRDDSGIWTP